MKAKQIKQSIFVILMIAVLMVGTSVVGVGAATQKTYLKDMLYSDIISESYDNSVTVYSGTDYNGLQCNNAVRYYVLSDDSFYSDEVCERGRTSYIVKYNLNCEYDRFISNLTHDDMPSSDMSVEIFTDDILVYSIGLSDDSPSQTLSIDTKNVKTISIKINCKVKWIGGHADIIFDNAYFTSEGTAPEPTEKPTQIPTQKPTVAPTNPIVNPTVAPTTAKPAVTPTKDVEDTTTATNATVTSEETTTKVYPTASTNPTSKISTTDTATKDSANKGSAAISNNKGNSDNGTIQTGAISIAVILFVVLASLATGGFVWYRRKIK